MIKNDAVASRRTLPLLIMQSDGVTPADRSTDFTGCAWLDQGGGSLIAASGTPTNSRRALTFTAFTFTVNTGTSTSNLSATAHGLQNGDGPIRLTTTGALPTGLATATDYYVILVDANTIKLATSLANAYAATPVTFSTNGSGTNQVTGAGTTPKRGLDGCFYIQLSQAETNVDSDYLQVRVEKTNYAIAYAYAKFDIAGSVWDQIAEGSHTYGDLQRLKASILAGPVLDFTTNTLVFKSLDGTKTRWTVTVSAAGRLSVVPGDLT